MEQDGDDESGGDDDDVRYSLNTTDVGAFLNEESDGNEAEAELTSATDVQAVVTRPGQKKKLKKRVRSAAKRGGDVVESEDEAQPRSSKATVKGQK
jgi:hypothetical protein